MIKKPIISFVGYSNSGKTTLICKILNILSKDYKIAVIKHHGHFANKSSKDKIKDTDKFLLAGAKKVFLLIGDKSPENIINMLNKKNIDLIIIEGFKNFSYPKFYVKREEIKEIDYNLDNLVGMITDDITGLGYDNVWFNIDDIKGIINFIRCRFLKGE